ncbi:HigA family addiction module antitoxin [Granulicella arctica]|uniref:Addiction module HigA family antidote n=1 Tax=Granulicella arctica TaxID=940613 RepID=A0A7Y9PE81_9BACT|nr:HigA family addiction module antitoxin [Granulicella arctica]NYF78244.1 addiction module HigA family antidote [Granulicella arctica]
MTIKRPAAGWRIKGVMTHPGIILNEDFLKPMGISANHLAVQTRMPPTRVGEILHGRRSVTPDTALRLARYFGTSAEFWLNLQAGYDLSKARLELESIIQADVRPLKLEAAGTRPLTHARRAG